MKTAKFSLELHGCRVRPQRPAGLPSTVRNHTAVGKRAPFMLVCLAHLAAGPSFPRTLSGASHTTGGRMPPSTHCFDSSVFHISFTSSLFSWKEMGKK